MLFFKKGLRKKVEVRLSKGQLTPPLSLSEIEKWIQEGKLKGTEQARELPDGSWKNINEIPEIAELFLKKLGVTQLGRSDFTAGKTVKLGEQDVAGLDDSAPQRELEIVEGPEPTEKTEIDFQTVGEAIERVPDNPTLFAKPKKKSKKRKQSTSDLANQETVAVLNRKNVLPSRKASLGFLSKLNPQARLILIGLAVIFMALELFFDSNEDPQKTPLHQIRIELPNFSKEKADPKKSVKFYTQGMRMYLEDTVLSYQRAVKLFLLACEADISNVKALALLASSYLNLVDASNKDSQYFSVISKLIEMSKANNLDLAESLIAEVEFLLVSQRPEAAQVRIVEYTKVHQDFPRELFYYLAFAFYERGDYEQAARFLSQYPEEKAFSPRIFFLRGKIAEKFKLTEEALQNYARAIKMNPNHIKSRLHLSALLKEQGRLKEAEPHVGFVIEHTSYGSSDELAKAYYFQALIYELKDKWPKALEAIQKAMALDARDPDIILEYYALKAKEGQDGKNKNEELKRSAQMFYYLGAGQKKFNAGDHPGALGEFLRARKENENEALPLVKVGDTFLELHNLNSAKINYKKALELVPKNLNVWSKYIKTLIETFEWEEAQSALGKVSELTLSKSTLDRLYGDLYLKQGQFLAASTYYQRAMKRDQIDPDVYLAYAKTLMIGKRFADAPFFFALTRRYDPLNMEALVGIARALSETESLGRAIEYLEDESSKLGGTRSEILTALAEFQARNGNVMAAEAMLTQAMEASAEDAKPWLVKARLYMDRLRENKKNAQKALEALQSYTQRNPSDPEGYLEKYRLYVLLSKFEEAKEELGELFGLFPKYPNLHYYWGKLYSVMGNHQLAIKEFQEELQNHTDNVNAMIAVGKELISIGGVNEAISFLENARQVMPAEAEATQWLGYANYLLKNYSGAIALYQDALQYDSGNPLIYKRMGLAYLANGDRDKASEAFRKYLDLDPDASDRQEIEKYL